MRIFQITLLWVFLSLIFPNKISATIFTSVASGDWSTSSTWDKNSIPTSIDTVIIDGDEVTLYLGVLTVKRLYLTNSSGSGNSRLILGGIGVLIVTEDMEVTAEKQDFEVEVQLSVAATLIVNGDLSFVRASNNTKDKMLRLNMKNLTDVFVDGNFTFNYQNAHPSEGNEEIKLSNYSNLEVGKNMYLNVSGGADFNFNVFDQSEVDIDSNLIVDVSNGDTTSIFFTEDTYFILGGDLTLKNSGGFINQMELNNSTGTSTIGGNITMNSTATNNEIKLSISGDAKPEILGNITMIGAGDEDVLLDLKETTTTYVGGDIIRTDFGALDMEDGSTLILYGCEQQTLPCGKMPNSGVDDFQITNLKIQNTSGLPLNLEGPVTISKDLNLSNGIIKTSASKTLTLADGAMIVGASDTAYIDGPLTKKGITNDQSFIFPIGDSLTYAPIEISKVTDVTSEITASYLSDPPPWGTVASLNNVSSTSSWEIDKTSGTSINVTIPWTDGAAQGVTNIDDMVVARLDESTSGSEIWENYGNSATTGTAEEGSVTSALTMSDPPPWGTVKFTLGSISALNSLPVELTNFSAVQQKNQIYLQWETASEQNTREFVIEHSIDGVSFSPIGKVFSNGNSTIDQRYNFSDVSPSLGMNYYRLKINDLDDSFEHSPIEVVKFELDSELNIFPNPVTKYLHIQGNVSDSEDIILEVFDRDGKRLYMENVNFQNGQIELDTDSIYVLESGTYFIRLTGRVGSKVLKFIKAY